MSTIIELIAKENEIKQSDQMTKELDQEKFPFEMNLYKIEIERIKYLLRNYARTRLFKVLMILIRKIEKNYLYIYKNKQNYLNSMSKNEQEFVDE